MTLEELKETGAFQWVEKSAGVNGYRLLLEPIEKPLSEDPWAGYFRTAALPTDDRWTEE